MRLLICGGRHFHDAARIDSELSSLHAATPIRVIIHGGLPGIGAPAEAWARRNNVHVIRYPANFSQGKSGDFTRDRFMLADSRAEALLAFPGGRRTGELVRQAITNRLRVMFAQDEPELDLLHRYFKAEASLNVSKSVPPIDLERQLVMR